MHRVAGLVGQRVNIGENVFLVIHQDVRRSAVAARRKCAAAFPFCFVTIAPAGTAQTFFQNLDIFVSQWRERGQDHFRCLIETRAHFNFRYQRNVSVVMMQLAQPQRATTQIEITKQRLQICPDGINQSVVDRERHIIGKERRHRAPTDNAGPAPEKCRP